MFRSLLGTKDQHANKMASTITQNEFKDALSRYPEVLKGLTRPGKSSPFNFCSVRYIYLCDPDADVFDS